MAVKIVITDADTVFDEKITPEPLSRFGELEIFGLTRPKELANRIKDAEILLCNKTEITREALFSAKKLRYIGLFATGCNNIDLAAARERGVTVCNVPGYSTESVAQHTFALMLAIFNHVGEYNRTVLRGDWIKSRTFSYFPFPPAELCGKTLGIVGYGAIGRRVAEIGSAFGMNIIACRRNPIEDDNITQLPLLDLLPRCDIVSLHCPLNADSENMINEKTLSLFKKGAVLINTARGGLVDERALADALISGRLSGAGLDVLRKEPMSPDCPLLGAPNCYITPHIAWAGTEPRTRLISEVCGNLSAFLSGAPKNTVTA